MLSSFRLITKNLVNSSHGKIVRDTSRACCSFVNQAPSTSTKTFSMTCRSFGSKKQVVAASGKDILASLGNDFEGNNIADAMFALANADAVCFDVDSTVIQEEGIVSL